MYDLFDRAFIRQFSWRPDRKLQRSPRWENTAGLRKLDENTQLNSRISRLESRMDHVSSMETRIDQLETRLAVLTLEFNNFLKIRLYISEGASYMMF